MNPLSKKVLHMMTEKGIVIARDPYTLEYSIALYPDKETLTVEFPTHADAVAAKSHLAKQFDWIDIHELTSFQHPRWILVATFGTPHQGTASVH